MNQFEYLDDLITGVMHSLSSLDTIKFSITMRSCSDEQVELKMSNKDAEEELEIHIRLTPTDKVVHNVCKEAILVEAEFSSPDNCAILHNRVTNKDKEFLISYITDFIEYSIRKMEVIECRQLLQQETDSK